MKGYLWVCGALVLLLLGCGESGRQRMLPQPIFDPRLPFPELAIGVAMGDVPSRSLLLPREERVSYGGEVLCGPPEDGPLVQLAGSPLFGRLPADNWRWATREDGKATLLVRTPGLGEESSAWILTQAVSGIPQTGTFRPFHAWVDHRLEFEGQILDAGFFSLRGSFTGWRWLGPCAPSSSLPFFQLARSHGTWRHGKGEESAYSVLGNAGLRSVGGGIETTLRIAVICGTASGTCESAKELAQFLGTIHKPSTERKRDALFYSAESFAELAEEVGLAEENESVAIRDTEPASKPAGEPPVAQEAPQENEL